MGIKENIQGDLLYKRKIKGQITFGLSLIKNVCIDGRNQDGGVGRHTAPPRTTGTDRESNSKGDRHQGNRK